MSGVRIEVKVDGKEVGKALGRLAAAGKDLGPTLRSIGEAMLRSTDQNFSNERSPDGDAWARNAPATLAKKKNGKVLTESTALRGSIAYRVAGDVLAWGSRLVYARIHQKGGTITQKKRRQLVRFRKDGRWMSKADAGQATDSVAIRFAKHKRRSIKMPARPYLGVGAKDREKILRLILRRLEREG